MWGDGFWAALVPVPRGIAAQLVTGDNMIGFANPWARRRTRRATAASSTHAPALEKIGAWPSS
jgi:hypothetical protein